MLKSAETFAALSAVTQATWWSRVIFVEHVQDCFSNLELDSLVKRQFGLQCHRCILLPDADLLPLVLGNDFVQHAKGLVELLGFKTSTKRQSGLVPRCLCLLLSPSIIDGSVEQRNSRGRMRKNGKKPLLTSTARK